MTKVEIHHETINRAAQNFSDARYADAFRDYLALAEGGGVECQEFVGWMYHRGTGTSKDDSRAALWLSRAAQSGSISARYRLGILHQLDNDYLGALEHYRQSAEADHSPSLVRLGKMHEAGLGVARSSQHAMSYYEKARRLGNIQAERRLGSLLLREQGFRVWHRKLAGLFYFLRAFVKAARSALKDPHDERLLG